MLQRHDSPLRLEVLGGRESTTPRLDIGATGPRRKIVSWSPDKVHVDGGSLDSIGTRKWEYLRARSGAGRPGRPGNNTTPDRLIASADEAARMLEGELHTTRVALAESLRNAANLERQRDAEREHARMREIDIENEREAARQREQEHERDLESRTREFERQRASDATATYTHSVIVALLRQRRLYRKRLEALWGTQDTASCVRVALTGWRHHHRAERDKQESHFWRSVGLHQRAHRKRVMQACVYRLRGHAEDARLLRRKTARRNSAEAALERQVRELLRGAVALWGREVHKAVRSRLQLALTDSLDIAESLSAQRKSLAARVSVLRDLCSLRVRRDASRRGKARALQQWQGSLRARARRRGLCRDIDAFRHSKALRLALSLWGRATRCNLWRREMGRQLADKLSTVRHLRWCLGESSPALSLPAPGRDVKRGEDGGERGRRGRKGLESRIRWGAVGRVVVEWRRHVDKRRRERRVVAGFEEQRRRQLCGGCFAGWSGAWRLMRWRWSVVDRGCAASSSWTRSCLITSVFESWGALAAGLGAGGVSGVPRTIRRSFRWRAMVAAGKRKACKHGLRTWHRVCAATAALRLRLQQQHHRRRAALLRITVQGWRRLVALIAGWLARGEIALACLERRVATRRWRRAAGAAVAHWVASAARRRAQRAIVSGLARERALRQTKRAFEIVTAVTTVTRARKGRLSWCLRKRARALAGGVVVEWRCLAAELRQQARQAADGAETERREAADAAVREREEEARLLLLSSFRPWAVNAVARRFARQHVRSSLTMAAYFNAWLQLTLPLHIPI